MKMGLCVVISFQVFHSSFINNLQLLGITEFSLENPF